MFHFNHFHIAFLTNFYLPQSVCAQKPKDGDIPRLTGASGEGKDVTNNIKWDIFIMKNNDYKEYLIEYFKKNEDYYSNNPLSYTEVLTKSLPKYIWVIQGLLDGKILFDFIYDTVENNIYGMPISVNFYFRNVEKHFIGWRDAFNRPDVFNSFSSIPEVYEKSLLKTLHKSIKITSRNLPEFNQIIAKVDKIKLENILKYEESHKEMIEELRVKTKEKGDTWDDNLKYNAVVKAMSIDPECNLKINEEEILGQIINNEYTYKKDINIIDTPSVLIHSVKDIDRVNSTIDNLEMDDILHVNHVI